MTENPLQRALRQAPERAAAAQQQAEQELFCFRLGDLKLAVPSQNVLEVFRATALTPLPKSPAFILGVCGHRGNVIPVLDLLRFLGKGEARVGTRTRLFLGVSGSYIAGVVADTVVGLRRFPSRQILAAPLGGDSAAEHVAGVVSIPGEQSTTSILNFGRVLAAARQRAVTR